MAHPEPDYSTWFTKQAAAEAIGVSTKTIEKFADEKKIEQAQWKRPSGGARIVVYHPGDVERMRKERNPDASPFVMPAKSTTQSLAVRQNATDALTQSLTRILGTASEMSQKKQIVSVTERLYLTFQEASEYTGLGIECIRRHVSSGNLRVLKGAGPRGANVINRKDLEILDLTSLK